MSKKTITVTVAISAFNEEDNIVAFLQSVLNQKQEGYSLEKIIVVSDGSTDSTVQKAKSLNSKLLEIIVHKTRAGKPTRMNEIYKMCKSDILVENDADTIYFDRNGLRDIVASFKNDEKVMMAGGQTVPFSLKSFVEKSINASFVAHQRIVSK